MLERVLFYVTLSSRELILITVMTGATEIIMVYITLEQVIQYDYNGEYLYVEIDGEIFTLKFDEVVFIK